jgi:hypothetical protein
MTETIISAILGCVCGNISAFMFFPQNRRSKEIENQSKESDEWRKLYKCMEEAAKEKEIKIDSLYAEISKRRDENSQMQVKAAELEVENARLKILKCEVPACAKRQPPTGF